jgi:hypothetical protein
MSPVPPQASNIIYQREKNGRRERERRRKRDFSHTNMWVLDKKKRRLSMV